MHQFTSSFGKLSSFVLGISVSMVMLAAVIPSLVTGTLSDKHGRLKIIAPGAVLCGIGAILQGSAFNLGQFIVGRAISGVGQGMFYGSISVYITEISPLHKRGRLAAMPQFMATLGVCIGYFCCYGTTGVENSLAWRLPYTIQVLVAAALALVCLTLPESPRWLVIKGRGDEARQALALLDFDMAEAQRDFLSAVQEQPSLSNRQSFKLLFRRGYRSRTFLALFLCSAVQLSGIDAITYVSRSGVNFVRLMLNLLRNLVRSGTIHTSRYLCRHLFTSGFWRLVHHHASHLYTGFYACRPMGSKNLDNKWRHCPHWADVLNRQSLCCRWRTRRRRSSVGSRCVRVSFRHGVLRNMGHCWENICQRDYAWQYPGSWKFGRNGI